MKPNILRGQSSKIALKSQITRKASLIASPVLAVTSNKPKWLQSEDYAPAAIAAV
jgi:hypothetical protein